jgi:hypothetical protein
MIGRWKLMRRDPWFRCSWIITTMLVALFLGILPVVLMTVFAMAGSWDRLLTVAAALPLSGLAIMVTWIAFRDSLLVALTEVAWLTGVCPRWSARRWMTTLEQAGADVVVISYLAQYLTPHLIRRWHQEDRRSALMAVRCQLAECTSETARPALVLLLARLTVALPGEVPQFCHQVA